MIPTDGMYLTVRHTVAFFREDLSGTERAQLMRLNDTTDLALRIMIYAASVHPRRFNIDQIVQTYALPRSTIMKVVSSLTQGALLSAQRDVEAVYTSRVKPQKSLSATLFNIWKRISTWWNACVPVTAARLPKAAN